MNPKRQIFKLWFLNGPTLAYFWSLQANPGKTVNVFCGIWTWIAGFEDAHADHCPLPKLFYYFKLETLNNSFWPKAAVIHRMNLHYNFIIVVVGTNLDIELFTAEKIVI